MTSTAQGAQNQRPNCNADGASSSAGHATRLVGDCSFLVGSSSLLRKLCAKMTTMKSNHSAWARNAVRLLRDPTIHFFILGALIFLVHRLVAGDSRTIVITPALRADLERRFQDQWGRSPSDAELNKDLQGWKCDEALYREALSQGLDREEPMVRTFLIDKLRDRAALQFPVPEPSEADLDQWLEQHRTLYEVPLVYEHEYVVFPKTGPGAEQQREKYERALKAGATPPSLGLRTVAANVRRERIEQDFGPEVARRICALPIGEWQPLENDKSLLLVRMIRIEGGMPSRDALRDRLVVDRRLALQQKAAERAAQSITARYRFEERSK